MKKRPFIIAHRGASAYEKENTLRAFELATKQGADFVELDIRQTKDKVLVVSHGRGIKKGRRRYWIDKNPLSILEGVSDDQILTLEKVLEKFAGKAGFFLDLKQAGMEKSVAGLIKKYGLKNTVLMTNNGFTLLNLKKALPTCQTILYYEPGDRRDICEHWWVRTILLAIAFVLSLPIKKLLPRFFLGKVLTFGADGVSLYRRFLTKKMVEDFHQEGLKVFVWGIENEAQARKVLAFGVEGIITKRPDVAKKLLISNYFPIQYI